ncbi:MAG: MFS transporter [Gammaproteobacteria bacterium]|nr:MAG: MFS transporter [Gammaproteobacteria bacterium]
MSNFWRNVPLLALSQALMMSAASLIIATAALVGAALAEDKSLATLPLAMQFIAVMLTSIPAAMLMQRIGRKPAFMFATLFGVAAGILTTTAIIQGEFWLFVVGTMFVGIFNGFGNYYRFAAADAVALDQKSRAISYVMVGGVIAAIVGPNLARITKDSIASAAFAGSYASLIALYVLSFLVLAFIKLPGMNKHNKAQSSDTARSLKQIAAQPKFMVALICGMFGYGVMTLVMTATPLAMDHHHHHFDDTSFVIQWHVLGMFAPSFFTGHLIRRYDVLNIMFIGGLMGVACVVINLLGTSVWHFWFALLLLGISWNFLFIGATTLLTETYHPQEQTRAQAVNDFAIFTTVALSSLSAGALQHQYGWQAVNLGVTPLLLLILLSIVWLLWRQSIAGRH